MFESGQCGVTAAEAAVQLAFDGFRGESVGDLFFDLPEKRLECGKPHFEFRVVLRPAQRIFHLPDGGPAAVISQPEPDGEVPPGAVFGVFCHIVEFSCHLAFAAVCALEPDAEDTRSSLSFPMEEIVRQGKLRLVRARKRKTAYAGPGENFRHSAAVAKRVRRPCDLNIPVELFPKIAFADFELFKHGGGFRHILVGLNPVSADDFPPSGRRQVPNRVEESRIALFNMRINCGFSPDEREFRVQLHQPHHGTAGFHPFVHPFAPIPEPYRINVRIGQQMQNFLHKMRLWFIFWDSAAIHKRKLVRTD
ncbi:hypothetical protein SDC9_115519 [bioreactor metagenome]|uniref:Uncharacterized protein n=1 Tax=bioreactor metagenome TaxID=1076179 RepID=A0A645BTD2_9ZZZZ